MTALPLFFPDRREVCQILTAGGWQPCQLVGTGDLTLASGEWLCSPSEFARRYRAGTARMVARVGTVVDPAAAEFGDLACAALAAGLSPCAVP